MCVCEEVHNVVIIGIIVDMYGTFTNDGMGRAVDRVVGWVTQLTVYERFTAVLFILISLERGVSK